MPAAAGQHEDAAVDGDGMEAGSDGVPARAGVGPVVAVATAGEAARSVGLHVLLGDLDVDQEGGAVDDTSHRGSPWATLGGSPPGAPPEDTPAGRPAEGPPRGLPATADPP